MVAPGTPALLALVARARGAATAPERTFVLLDRTRDELPYHAAVLCRDGRLEHSGVSALDPLGPYGQWLARLAKACRARPAGALTADALDAALAQEAPQWWPPHLLWLPAADNAIGLLLARETPWSDAETAWLGEWFALWLVVDDAARLGARRGIVDWRVIGLRLRGGGGGRARLRWGWLAAAAFAGALCIPVHLTVRAAGEIVPREPTVLRAPLDGTARRLLVEPNQPVRAGQLLAELDDAAAESRLQVARQTLATAEAEWRQTSQAALGDARAKAQLAGALGRVEEKRTEVGYLGDQVRRTELHAPHDGVVLVDDPGAWAGRTVAAGEPLLRLARPDDQEVEAWLPVADAIDLAPDSAMRLFLASKPASPVAATLRLYAYEAQPRPDGVLAYRLRGRLVGPSHERLGLRGTVHADGERVPLAYWMLRRPLAALREVTGW